MSLTNPVFNDIITKEINILRNVILNLECNIEKSVNKSNLTISELSDRLTKQDAKIDVIHKLFNSYKNVMSAKNNKEDKRTPGDSDILKKRIDELENNTERLTSFLVSLMNDKFVNQQEQIEQLKSDVNDKINCRSSLEPNKLSIIDKTNKDLLEQMTNIRNQYNNFSKSAGDNNYRLNGLENKYRSLDRRFNNLYDGYEDSRYNRYGDNNYIDNDSDQINDSPRSNDENRENWIKVTKKKKNKKAPYRY